MNLNSRLSKLETGPGLNTVSLVIIAEDQADFDWQFEEGFLRLPKPCHLSVSGKVAGVPFQREDMEILSHEEYVELLS